jgi:magnesium transporter
MELPEPLQADLASGKVAAFAGRRLAPSVRDNSRQGFPGLREGCERESEHLKQGSGFVLYASMDAVVDRYFPVLGALEIDLEQIEGQILGRGAAHWNIRRLYDLKRRVTVLCHVVAPLLEVAGKLHGGQMPAVCGRSQEYFRDVHGHLARINTAIEGIRDTIATATQVNLSMATIDESEAARRLAAWAATFAVSTALAGIRGMKLEHMPELKGAWGYPMAPGAIAASAGPLFWRFRRSGCL